MGLLSYEDAVSPQEIPQPPLSFCFNPAAMTYSSNLSRTFR